MRYAYLHGFASSATSRKGVALRDAFAQAGLTVHLPDLNRPSFAKLTFSAALEAMTELDTPGPAWCLVGSSMGGALAALWAEQHPGRVAKLVLLAPAFDFVARWEARLGEDAFRLWEKKGAFFFPDAQDEPTPVHYGLIEDARRYAAFPAVPCPTLIIHGRADESVSIAQSRDYVREHPAASLIEVDDDHQLRASTPFICSESLRFFQA